MVFNHPSSLVRDNREGKVDNEIASQETDVKFHSSLNPLLELMLLPLCSSPPPGGKTFSQSVGIQSQRSHCSIFSLLPPTEHTHSPGTSIPNQNNDVAIIDNFVLLLA